MPSSFRKSSSEEPSGDSFESFSFSLLHLLHSLESRFQVLVRNLLRLNKTVHDTETAFILDRLNLPVFLRREFSMNITLKWGTITLAALIVLAGSGQSIRADECDDIMGELKKLSERLMNTSDPKGVGPVCAATGELLGIIRASREVAAECYEEGRKRDQILLAFDKGIKDIQGNVDSVCK
jgi:hypothetical protein